MSDNPYTKDGKTDWGRYWDDYDKYLAARRGDEAPKGAPPKGPVHPCLP